jgi:hypothetical protein
MPYNPLVSQPPSRSSLSPSPYVAALLLLLQLQLRLEQAIEAPLMLELLQTLQRVLVPGQMQMQRRVQQREWVSSDRGDATGCEWLL